MKNTILHIFSFLFTLSLLAQENSLLQPGTYSGVFEKGNFKDDISFTLQKEKEIWTVSFTSLKQNAIGIPARQVSVIKDSISFILQSDRYTYIFKNKWEPTSQRLKGTLFVDEEQVSYSLIQETSVGSASYNKEEVTFHNMDLKLSGTIYRPDNPNGNALVFLTSSGGGDRSGSRAEAIYFAKKGITTFHYDKRGTGQSEGNWQTAKMDDLVEDDINAITFFSKATGISLSEIGIKGSSQGATKVPYLLFKMPSLAYGIAVSCPASSLLESDLNAWKNANSDKLGDDLEAAANLQRKVFQYIGGLIAKEELEKAISENESASWFTAVWIPNLDEVVTDPKLSYSPMTYFDKVKQPLLLIQGTKDEIIPLESHAIISSAIKPSRNEDYQLVLLENANHSMYFVGESDFPYWAALHPEYLEALVNWLEQITGS